MPPPPNSDVWHTLVSAAAGAVGGILSAMAKDLFRDRKIAADDIEELGQELTVEAMVYWRKNGRDDDLEQSITRLTHKYQAKVGSFSRKYLDSKAASDCSLRLQQVLRMCTGDTFAQEDRIASRTQLSNLRVHTMAINSLLEQNSTIGTLRAAIRQFRRK